MSDTDSNMEGEYDSDSVRLDCDCDKRCSNNRLSIREKQALEKASNGFQSDKIADEMHISNRTVDAHLRKARFKLSAKNTTHAVAIALRKGIIASVTAMIAINSVISNVTSIRVRTSARTTISRSVSRGRLPRRDIGDNEAT